MAASGRVILAELMPFPSKLLEIALDPQKRKKALIAVCLGSIHQKSSISSSEKRRNVLDSNFLRQLITLLKIMVPGVFSKEAGII
ncbi:hypothetical protein DICVIV_04673, partial [Dictyocaulus viviparus]